MEETAHVVIWRRGRPTPPPASTRRPFDGAARPGPCDHRCRDRRGPRTEAVAAGRRPAGRRLADAATNAWTRLPVDCWDEHPYPGERPDCSWRLDGDHVHRVEPAGRRWRDAASGAQIDLGGRVFVLAYGSNATPSKLRGLDAVVLQSQITGAQAVWSEGRRSRDGAVVATVARVDGNVEACPVLAVYPEDLVMIDRWEGEGTCYHRRDFWGACTLENDVEVTAQVYAGGRNRRPLRHRGRLLPLHDVDHAFVDRLV